MARKKIHKEETRPWDWKPPVVVIQETDPDPPLRIEDVDGVPIEIRKRPGFGEVMRPPAFTTIGPDGEPYTERIVATAWFISHYQPWRRRMRGETATALPLLPALDGLLPDIATDEEDHGRNSETD